MVCAPGEDGAEESCLFEGGDDTLIQFCNGPGGPHMAKVVIRGISVKDNKAGVRIDEFRLVQSFSLLTEFF